MKYIIKRDGKFWVGGNKWSEEYPDAKEMDSLEQAERVLYITGGVIYENYGFENERIFCFEKEDNGQITLMEYRPTKKFRVVK